MSSMELFSIKESSTLTQARIVAVGVSGSGSNIINYMGKAQNSGIELIIANMDAQDHYESLRETLSGADVVFIITGLGGVTGTVVAPIIAKIAKEVGALTIGVVSKPFCFEGQKRTEIADKGLETLKRIADSVVVIPNDKLLSNIDTKLGIKECFKSVDSVFARVIYAIAGVIIPSGENDINLDFADLQTIMIHRGIAVIGIGEHQGKNAAYEAINNAMKFTMADGLTMKSASGVLVHFNMHPEFHFMELSAAMEVIHKSVDESAAGVEKSFMLVANNVYQ
jgi:cell division protein FtsZ